MSNPQGGGFAETRVGCPTVPARWCASLALDVRGGGWPDDVEPLYTCIKVHIGGVGNQLAKVTKTSK